MHRNINKRIPSFLEYTKAADHTLLKFGYECI